MGNLKGFDLTWQYFGENAFSSVPFPLQSMEIGKNFDAAYEYLKLPFNSIFTLNYVPQFQFWQKFPVELFQWGGSRNLNQIFTPLTKSPLKQHWIRAEHHNCILSWLQNISKFFLFCRLTSQTTLRSAKEAFEDGIRW